MGIFLGAFVSFLIVQTSFLAGSQSPIFDASEELKSLEKIQNELNFKPIQTNDRFNDMFRNALHTIRVKGPFLSEKARQARMQQEEEILEWMNNQNTSSQIKLQFVEELYLSGSRKNQMRIADQLWLKAEYFAGQLVWKPYSASHQALRLEEKLNTHYNSVQKLRRQLLQESFFILSNTFSDLKYDILGKLDRAKKKIDPQDQKAKEHLNAIIDSFYSFGADVSFSSQTSDLNLRGVLLGDNPENAYQNYQKLKFL